MISSHAMPGYFCPSFYVIYNWMLSKNRIICLTFYCGMQHITASCCIGCMFLLASFNYGALDAKIVCRLEVSSGMVESICIPHLLIRLQMVLKTFTIFHLTIADLFSVVMYCHAQTHLEFLSRHVFPVNLGYISEVAIRKNKGKLPNFSDHKLQKRGKTSKWSHTTAYIYILATSHLWWSIFQVEPGFLFSLGMKVHILSCRRRLTFSRLHFNLPLLQRLLPPWFMASIPAPNCGRKNFKAQKNCSRN